jgi:outer membrane lipoprotein carrier protein
MSLLLIAAVAVFQTNAFAAETLDGIMQKMEKADASIQTATFDFTQDIIYTLTNEKQSNTGTVTFAKPANIYMKQNNPIEQIIISNGSKVWVYTPSYKQAIVDSWKKWSANSMVPASLLNFGKNFGDLKKNYEFSYLGTEGGDHLILLQPKKKELWKMKFWIDAERFVPKKAEVSGDNVCIVTETKNYAVNPTVDKKIFTFKAPAGVDVLQVP